MALVVLLRGVNVGGYRKFRPSVLAAELKRLNVINIGAAGTFVVRQAVTRAELRGEIARRLPFDAEIAICQGRDILSLMARDYFAGQPEQRDVVPFVSVLTQRPRSTPQLPMQLPSEGRWLLRILAREGRFVVGQYRREMKAIGYLGSLDRLFGAPATTRNWSTIAAIAKVLENGAVSSS